MFIQFLTTTNAAGKFQSYLKEEQSSQNVKFRNAFMNTGSHPEDRSLNESFAPTARKDTAQLY